MKKLKSITRAAYDSALKHYILWIMITSFFCLYFPTLTYFGNSLKLTTQKTILTGPGVGVSVAVITLTILLNVLKAIGEKYNNQVKDFGIKVLSRVIQSSNYGRVVKLDYYKGFIRDNDKKSICRYMGPSEQLDKILKESSLAISQILGITPDEVGYILIYKLGNKDLYQIKTSENMNGAVINVKNKNILKLIPKAIQDGTMKMLIPKIDLETEINPWLKKQNINSLYFENLSIPIMDNVIIEAYIIISTFNYQICRADDQESKRKFESIIMPILVRQYQLELSKIYIQYLNKCPTHKDEKVEIDEMKESPSPSLAQAIDSIEPGKTST
jgi:hypothetical protein